MRVSRNVTSLAASILTILSSGHRALAQDSNADLAKKLSNPIASLISVPFQFNYDSGYGPEDGDREILNIQPVIPISLNEDWNLISRTIMPVIWQNDIAGDSGHQFGLGDITQSLFFSPKQPGPGGIIWGAGPVFLLPTATDELLGSGKWGAGPTAVALKQEGPWTYGMLANHIWSFAGQSDRDDVSSTFLQPFVAYTTPDAWTFTLNTESTYDWEHNDWSVPINFQVSKLLKFGEQPVSLTAGARYWVESPETGPDGWGVRLAVTFLFPK
ncbi:transporter [Sinorhizobium chiapasense]|uniref:Transporter n=1 Tax=Sinorhizobium chiapasense TaxID=501572 RepID=A0ABZ2B6V1_9HYPH